MKMEEQKTFKVEMPLESWQVVFGVIDESHSPHKQVTSVLKVLQDQLQGQVDAQKATPETNEPDLVSED